MASSLVNPGLSFATDKAIIASRRALAKVGVFATDYSADAVTPGTTLKIPVYSVAKAGTFDGSTNNYGTANGKIAYAAITFDHHVKYTFGFTDLDATKVDPSGVWNNAGTASGKSVGLAIEDAVMGLFTYSNAAKSVTQSITKANFAQLRATCADNDIDPAETVAVLTPTAFATLLGTLDANVYGSLKGIQEGVIEGLYGFKAVVESNALPTADSASTTKAWGVLVPDGAVAIAGRTVPVLSTKAYDEVGTTTDEVSGLTLGARRYCDPANGENYATVEALFGAGLTYDATNADNAPRFIQLKTA